MRNKFKAVPLLAALGALAIAMPAAAHPGNTNHPRSTNHPSGTQSCKTHNVAFIVGGTVTDVSGLTVNSDTPAGGLVITVTHANKWAKKDGASTGARETYTVTGAKVKFAPGSSSFANGDRVQLIGKFPMVRSHGKNACTAPTSSAPTFRVVVDHPAAS
jgi:hypothetical protein